MLNNTEQTETKTNNNERAAKPPKERDIFKMTASEIEQLFAWYDFTDKHGHQLINCQDFKHLVARTTK